MYFFALEYLHSNASYEIWGSGCGITLDSGLLEYDAAWICTDIKTLQVKYGSSLEWSYFCNVILSVLQHYRHFAGGCSVYILFGPSGPVVKNAQLGTLLWRDVSGHVLCHWFSPTRKQIRRKGRMVLNDIACEYCECGLFHGTGIKFMEPSSVGTRKRKLCL
jgi:hypothetical protein